MPRSLVAVVLSVLLFVSPAMAFDPWDDKEKAMLAVSTAALVIDWRQTVRISREPDRFAECNPLLGRHPSEGSVHLYFAAAAVGNVVIAHVLPAKYRKWWLTGTAVLSITCVGKNLGAGLGIRW